jgi:hypothetical protein
VGGILNYPFKSEGKLVSDKCPAKKEISKLTGCVITSHSNGSYESFN